MLSWRGTNGPHGQQQRRCGAVFSEADLATQIKGGLFDPLPLSCLFEKSSIGAIEIDDVASSVIRNRQLGVRPAHGILVWWHGDIGMRRGALSPDYQQLKGLGHSHQVRERLRIEGEAEPDFAEFDNVAVPERALRHFLAVDQNTVSAV